MGDIYIWIEKEQGMRREEKGRGRGMCIEKKRKRERAGSKKIETKCEEGRYRQEG